MWQLVCLMFFCACSSLSASDQQWWITIGGDALPAMYQTFNRLDDTIEVFDYHPGDAVAVALVKKSQVARLSRLMHDQFSRCGGFQVHASREQATVAATTTPVSRSKGVSYTIDNPAVAQTLVAQVDALEIEDTIVNLSTFQTRWYESSTGVDAAHWLRDYWIDLADSREDATVEEIDHGFPQPSVVLTLTGTEFPDEIVILGGHLDSTAGSSSRSPGADDDASGIASLTEVIRGIFNEGFRPKRTIKFMGYAGEEAGLLGSTDIAADFSSVNMNVVGVLQLDMTNYHGSTSDIYFVTDFTSAAQNQFLGELVDTYIPEVSWSTTVCGYGCSDHASWFRNGYPASFPFEARFGQHNPSIHSANDTLTQSGGDAEHAAKFTRLAAAYVAEMAKGDFQTVPTVPPLKVDVMAMISVYINQGNCPQPPIHCALDVNFDGLVNQGDLQILLPHWLETVTFSP